MSAPPSHTGSDEAVRAPDEGPRLDPLPIHLRPNGSLLTYFLLSSLLLGPLFPILFIPRFLRYHTLRYRIDDEGLSMEWGALFHKEISLSYARIQDIHLSSNVLERRLGLGKIEIQTASASAGAEMTIEGIPGLERLRNFLYARMRGAKGELVPDGAGGPAEAHTGRHAVGAGGDELTGTLLAVVEEIQGLRSDLRSRGAGEMSARSSNPGNSEDVSSGTPHGESPEHG